MKPVRKKSLMILAAGLSVAVAGIAWAQTPGLIGQALESGAIGEQIDGYMGFRTTPSAALRAEVDALNIKRRDVYTQLAERSGTTPKDVAGVTGCKTLANRVGQGRAYRLADGVWRIRGATPIDLPDYCAS